MRRNPAITVGFLIAIAIAMAWCFGVMLSRRFAGGEDYPPCSTQRVDPKGAKALYEAVDRLSGTTCERNFKRLTKLSEVSGSADAPIAISRQGHTLVLLNVHSRAFADGDDLDGGVARDFAVAGGRVVITVEGSSDGIDRVMTAAVERQKELRDERRKAEKEEAAKKKEEEKAKDAEAKSNPQEKKSPEDEALRERAKKTKEITEEREALPYKPAKSLRDAIQIDVVRDSLKPFPTDGHELDTPEGIAGIGGQLPLWRSRASLNLTPKKQEKKEADDEKEKDGTADTDIAETTAEESEPATKEPWQILATVEDKPVLAERRFGRGSIVVATDSYFATNQALSQQPVPEFLAWLMGDARHVIFNETHLGTQENPGIMTLARQYRLHGFFLGGVLLFVLFVWQSSSSLVPARDGLEPGARIVSGQGAVAGLVSLLRRGVSRSRLLQTCFDQWLRNHPHPSPALHARIEQARALLPDESKRPSRGVLVSLYQRLCETLHPNRH